MVNQQEMKKIMEQYSRNIEPPEGQVKVTRLPDYTTVYVEQIAGIGRSLFLNEYRVDGKTSGEATVRAATQFLSARQAGIKNFFY